MKLIGNPNNQTLKKYFLHPKITYNITIKTQQKITRNSRKNKKLRKKYVFSKKNTFQTLLRLD